MRENVKQSIYLNKLGSKQLIEPVGIQIMKST